MSSKEMLMNEIFYVKFVIYRGILCLDPLKLFHLGVKNLIYLLVTEKGFPGILYYNKLELMFLKKVDLHYIITNLMFL